MFKSILAAAAIAATAAIATVSPVEAKPKIDVDVFFGTPGYYYDPGYGYYDPVPVRPYRPVRPRPVYEYEDNFGVSCRGGAREVRANGFRDVRAVDCEGRRYRYQATRYGRSYVVTVSSRSGEILAVDRRRRY
jgi:hypothetical protein